MVWMPLVMLPRGLDPTLKKTLKSGDAEKLRCIWQPLLRHFWHPQETGFKLSKIGQTPLRYLATKPKSSMDHQRGFCRIWHLTFTLVRTTDHKIRFQKDKIHFAKISIQYVIFMRMAFPNPDEAYFYI